MLGLEEPPPELGKGTSNALLDPTIALGSTLESSIYTECILSIQHRAIMTQLFLQFLFALKRSNFPATDSSTSVQVDDRGM